MPDVGQPAPDLSLVSDTGETVELSALRGRPVVVDFYPRDDSPGCTAQTCGIRAAWGDVQRAGAIVLGVSPQDERGPARSRATHGLPFALLADADHAVTGADGVWADKTLDGERRTGSERPTVVVGVDGTLLAAFRNVKPEEHAAQVLEALA